MTFKQLAEYFKKLESNSSRLEITRILSELFKESGEDEIGRICYLLQGRVAPLFEKTEFGVAEKMMLRAISGATNRTIDEVTKIFKAEGDLGITIERIKNQEPSIKDNKKLYVKHVFESLLKVAEAGGEGSQDEKINRLSTLLSEADPLSARYIARIPVNKLRMGFSDMTVLDALSWMFDGDKRYRNEIEKSYNVRPDMGFVAGILKSKGLGGLSDIQPEIGTPILMTRAERMTSAIDIVDKIGKCGIEPKYDGFRLQIHISRIRNQESRIKNNNENLNIFAAEQKKKIYVRLFSRNLEDVTDMYPDVAEGVRNQIDADEAIFEGEAIGINIKTGQYLPFQETVQRKRKYDIEIKAKEIPLKLFAFDLLFKNGNSLLQDPFSERRRELEKTVKKGSDVYVAKQDITDDHKHIEDLFEDAVKKGLEGIMAKKLSGVYRAGARDFTWIKYKKSYSGKLADTIDCVVMGYDYGQGKRTDFGIGGFLIGVWDTRLEKFVTVSKIGTGLTDEEWRELKLKIKNESLRTGEKPAEYEVDKMMSCDVWVTPEIIVEIRADEITRSPVHTAGRVMKKTKTGNAQEVETAGFALRFPRLERFRTDKLPKDTTSVSEVMRIYQLQKK